MASSRHPTPIRTRTSASRTGWSVRPGASRWGSPMGSRTAIAAVALAVALVGACSSKPGPRDGTGPAPSGDVDAMLADVERRTFDFFWTTAHPVTHLVPDRYPTPSFSSIAAVGFGLTAYAIGAERGWVTRAAA